MRIKLIAVLLLVLPLAALAQNAPAQAPSAQNTPIGKWHTIDDDTGKVKSTVEIRDAGNGTLEGTVVELIDSDKGPNAVCDACKGERHNQPIVGMTIAWGLKPDGGSWTDGKILDPKNGKTYSAKMTPVDGGQKLEVRGYLGFSLLGRTQTWQRVE